MKIEYRDYDGNKVRIEEGLFGRKVLKPSQHKKGKEGLSYFRFHGIRI